MVHPSPKTLAWLAATLILGAGVGAFARPAAGDDSFEKDVRPLLIERCVKCHGPEKQKGGLRLDSGKAVSEGGESGPAIVPGRAGESLLIAAVRQSGDLKMPPDRRLKQEQVAALERWVNSGARWPESPGLTNDAREAAWRRHWAFQPIRDPNPPKVEGADAGQGGIDAFLLARLKEAGITPSPRADRRTLIRRASHDLTGLPPTSAEVEAFVADPDPDAFAKLVDRLLASPQYGERWGRHWLDVARYSDTKGYVYAREERFFVHAPTYRDWVVRAFNQDMPYDRFLLLQIAADREAPGDRPSLAAMGFLTLGRRFLGVTRDIIDDRIDVVARGTMGLTVGCARCHDHKYDPIPTADYYSLYGVFQNGTERLVPIAEPAARDEAFEKELAKRREALRKAIASSYDEASTRARGRLVDYLLAQRELSKYPEEGFDTLLAKTDVIPAFVRRWEAYLNAAAKAGDPVFVAWRKFTALRDDEFSGRAPDIARELARAGPSAVNPLVARAFAEPPKSIKDVAERYGRLFADVDRRWQELGAEAKKKSAAPPAALPDAAAEALRQVLYGPRSPCTVPDEEVVSTETFFDNETCVALWKVQGELDRWLIRPEAPPYAVALVDRDAMEEPRIFRRGNPANKGDEIPRRFLAAISGPDRKPFARGSGRHELARAIVDPANPLTARVWVNRVWQHHFGSGLVRTPSDFGLRAEPPSHPELLDWLARRLVAGGWSTKALHRLILLSDAYQRRSDGPDDPSARDRALQADPENRLLWRMNPRRLEFEELRDTMLAVSGELDRRPGGRAAELFPAGASNVRRTLYGLVDRQFLSGVLRVFDFANPDLHIPQRSETTVPQQALFAMNHRFVADRARALAAKVQPPKPDDRSEGVRRLYLAVYQRGPTETQRLAALAFLDASVAEPPPKVSPESLTWSYGYAAIDPAARTLGEFHPLPHFSGDAWGGGPQWPDAALGWVQLTAKGGHAGNDLRHAAVRRWTAPRDGTVTVKSTAIHEVKAGDGIRCWVVSSRHGVLKSETVHDARKSLDVDAIAVKAGDRIDFVVDLLAGLNSDEFLWAPEIREMTSPEWTAEGAPTWDAARDFVGPQPSRLTPWEQLAQVLLLSNETMFVD